MRISVNKNQLASGIEIAESVISSKNINTILSNCLFEVEKDFIKIISTDNEISVCTTIESQSDSNISFTANGKKFSSILKLLPDNVIEVDIDKNMTVNINSNSVKGKYKILGTDSSEYPELPETINKNLIEIDQIVLKEMIKKVIYSSALDSIKPVFNSIYIVSETKGTLTLIATDSRRLSMITRNIAPEAYLEEGIILPLKTVNEIYRLLGNDGICSMSFSNNQCYFKINNTEIISRVVDGQFPNYKQIIPKEYKLKAIIETAKIMDSVKRAMIFTREPSNKIFMTFEKDLLKIEANTPDLGNAEEDVEIESDGNEKIYLGINSQFLLDSIKHIDSYSFICGITGQMSPMTIIPENDNNYISVIMPIQIKNN